MAQIFNVTFDARDPRRLGGFWSAVTGYPVVEERDDLTRLSAPGHDVPDLLFMRVDDPTPGKNRLHLDLAAEDVAAEIVRLVDLGASLVDDGSATAPTWRSANGVRWVVLRDPEGNLLCLGDVPG
jgi:catechol 2,3-dioxygenase-like lactoylglutathione lyase family enzyme